MFLGEKVKENKSSQSITCFVEGKSGREIFFFNILFLQFFFFFFRLELKAICLILYVETVGRQQWQQLLVLKVIFPMSRL